jgi:hypothetical protein
MSVWFAVPSKRSPADANVDLSRWRAKGYKLALWRDTGDEAIECDMMLTGPYHGYHVAVNSLCKAIVAIDAEADWIVTGGDDMRPDPERAPAEIALECTAHFGGTFGVMQPTGDHWAHPERICGSPWMGREFCRRMYGGNGPFCEEYPHMWGDEEMHEVCKAMGILWNRDDLSHFHDHFQRPQEHRINERPNWMIRNDNCYAKYKPVFDRRKRAGFPGHEPCAK